MATGAIRKKGPVAHVFGGRLCLDYVNTVDAWSRPATRNDLPDYAALLAWARQLRALPDPLLDALRDECARHPAQAGRVHRQALELRSLLLRIFSRTAEGEPLAPDDVRQFEAWSQRARQCEVLRPGQPWAFELAPDKADLAAPLLAVVVSAMQLLTSEALSRVKSCPGPIGCGWLFLDLSKNRSRRWCSMQHCGTRAKFQPADA